MCDLFRRWVVGPPKSKEPKEKEKKNYTSPLSWFSDSPPDVYFPHFNMIIHYSSPSWIAHLSLLRHILLVVCVCVPRCVHLCWLHVSSSLALLLNFLRLGLKLILVRLAQQRGPGIILSPPPQGWGFRGVTTMSCFLLSGGDANTDTHASVASTLPNEPLSC